MTRKSTFRKIPLVLLSILVMLCMMPMTVFAADPTIDFTKTGSLTIKKTDGAGNPITDTSLEYTIYKVADLVQTNSSGVVTTEYILDTGVTMIGLGLSAGQALPTGVTAADFDGALPIGTAVTNSGSGTLLFDNGGAGLPLGLYLVVETGTPAGVSVANNFLVSIPMSEPAGWEYDITAEPKNTVVDGTVAKTVTGGTPVVGSPNTWTVSLGDTVNYEIEAKLPSTFTTTPYTTYTITDTPDPGLLIDMLSIVVEVNTTPPTILVPGTDYILTPVGTGFEIELITDPAIPGSPPTVGTQAAALTDGATVTITYDAKLDLSATGTSFTNAVQVDSAYETDSGSVTPPPIDPPTPPPVIETYTYALQKVDGDSGNAPLAGAEFAIMDSAGDYLAFDAGGWRKAVGGLSDPDLYTFTSAGPDAIVPFVGLAGGTYDIVELVAPSGYSLLAAPITVTIDQSTTDDADTSIPSSSGYTIQVVNTAANTWVLPGTGGIGIYIFTIGGAVLLAAAIILFAKSRKKRNEA